jgi:hypothetical protein
MRCEDYYELEVKYGGGLSWSEGQTLKHTMTSPFLINVLVLALYSVWQIVMSP